MYIKVVINYLMVLLMAKPDTRPVAALKKAVIAAGGQTELARQLSEMSGKNIKQQQIWNWINREKQTPASKVVFVEKASGVARCELRPDLYAD